MRIVVLRKIDLENVHFRKSSKVRYRLHLTAGMLFTTGLYIVGAITDHPGLGHAATGMNLVTALMWIWE